MNLNNSKSLGSLTAADLDEAQAERSPAPRIPRIPMGLDYQGRYPVAYAPAPAEACTELGADDAHGEGAGVVLWPLAVILAIAAASFLVWVAKR